MSPAKPKECSQASELEWERSVEMNSSIRKWTLTGKQTFSVFRLFNRKANQRDLDVQIYRSKANKWQRATKDEKSN